MESNEINAIADRISDKLIDIVKKQLGEPVVKAGLRWVKALDFKHKLGEIYHAKDDRYKGAGLFDIHGNFKWGDGSITFRGDQGDMYILDESEGESDAVEFAEWAATIAFFDDATRLWELMGEGEAINGQFRFSTKEFFDIFKQQKEKR